VSLLLESIFVLTIEYVCIEQFCIWMTLCYNINNGCVWN